MIVHNSKVFKSKYFILFVSEELELKKIHSNNITQNIIDLYEKNELLVDFFKFSLDIERELIKREMSVIERIIVIIKRYVAVKSSCFQKTKKRKAFEDDLIEKITSSNEVMRACYFVTERIINEKQIALLN